jgi:RNA polymerase sigma-70 factor (ECF subfamily)
VAAEKSSVHTGVTVTVRQAGLALLDHDILEVEESTPQDVVDLRRWKDGDVMGFNALMSRYERRLYRLIWKVVRNNEDTQDVLQETFIRLHRSVDRLREDVSLQPWLFRTASNLAIDHLRKVKPGRTISLDDRQQETGQEPETIHGESPDDPHRRVVRKQLEERLVAALNRLPKRQRMAMTLRCLRDLSMREIAKVLKCKERTVGTTLFAARKKLMKELEPLLSDLLHAR